MSKYLGGTAGGWLPTMMDLRSRGSAEWGAVITEIPTTKRGGEEAVIQADAPLSRDRIKMHSRLSGRKILTLKVQVPSKTWCEGQTSITCLLCANENAEGFSHMSSVLCSPRTLMLESRELKKKVSHLLSFCGVKWVLKPQHLKLAAIKWGLKICFL